MKTIIDALLGEKAGELSEDTLTKVNEMFDKAVDERVQLVQETEEREATQKLAQLSEQFEQKLEEEVSKKLQEQDEYASQQLKEAFEKIDAKYAEKAKILEEEKDRVVKTEIKRQAEELAEELDTFLESWLDETIPSKTIEEMAQNTRSKNILDEITKIVSVANVGQEIQEESEAIKAENESLKEKLNAYDKAITLEERCKGLPEDAVRHLTETFKKPEYTTEFINDNFDFALNQYQKSNKKEIVEEKKRATKKANRKQTSLLGEKAPKQSIQNQTPIMESWQKSLNVYRTNDTWLDDNGNVL